MDPSSSLSTSALFADLGLVLFALFLVLLNGFFVAAEFAMVKLRATKVAEIAGQHGWRGHILRTVHRQLDAYLSACQLGITLASLGLGWVGEPAFAELITPVLSYLGVDSPQLVHGISFFTAFFIISYLHIVVGELAPKSWAIRKPELLSLWTAVPLYLFYWAMYPAIWVLNSSANAILRIAGQGDAGGHHEHHYSSDELKLILHSSRARDPSDQGMRVLASTIYDTNLEVVDWANSREMLAQMALPVTVLALFNAAEISRYTRSSILENLGQDYVRTARAKGMGEGKVVLKHVLRNSLIPVVTVVALGLPTVFGGAIVTEQIFKINGIGAMLIGAINVSDLPTVQTVTFIFAVLIVMFNLIADILYGILDPRIRYD